MPITRGYSCTTPHVNELGHQTALAKLASRLPGPARRYLHTSVAGIETLGNEGSRALKRIAHTWLEGRELRLEHRAQIASGRPHRNGLEPFVFEINVSDLPP